MTILITGSLGLVGFTSALHFLAGDNYIIGIDNNMRANLFGSEINTKQKLSTLKAYSNYLHYSLDIRRLSKLETIFKQHLPEVIIHTAAQPSHDKAREIPLLDFEINARGTLNLLEATRKYTPQATFIFTSTNKVYGNNPNKVKLKETKTRYIFANPDFIGFDETTPIDQTTHSLFGASKTSADLYVQEYGKYFGLKTTCLRLGCITGKSHEGVKLHGFISYLVKSLKTTQSYEIIGYKGKQVRDQIHAKDLVKAFEVIIDNPNKGEVFNLGGGTKNTISVIEAVNLVSNKLGIKAKIKYRQQHRIGDHICYISNINKFKNKYPNWEISYSIEDIINEQITTVSKTTK